jgi:hypothetical protein
MTASMSNVAYHVASRSSPANRRIDVRYSRAAAKAIRSCWASLCPSVRRGDRERRDETLEVPFEGPLVGLVKVVHVKDQVTFGRREQIEVREVRVTADLYLE